MGDGPNSYQFWLGGSPNQTRLAEVFQDRVKIQVPHLPHSNWFTGISVFTLWCWCKQRVWHRQ